MQLKPILFLIWLGFLGCFTAIGQTEVNKEGVILPIEIYKTQNYELSLDEVLSNNYTFNSSVSFKEKSHPKDIFWLKVDFLNEIDKLETQENWYLYINYFEYASIYFKTLNGTEELKFGSFENILPRNSILYSTGIPFTKEQLFENRYLYLKVQRVVSFSTIKNWEVEYFEDSKMNILQNYYSNKDLNYLMPVYLFSGICIIMFLFTLMFFLYAKRLEFLFYSLYTLFLILYLTPDVLRLHELFFGKFSLISYTFFQISQIAVNLFYVLFVMYYLNTRIVYPTLNKVLKYIAYFLIAVFIIDIVALNTKQFVWHIYILNFERLIMSLFAIGGMIYLVVKGKNRLSYFVVIGSFFYLAGALGFLFFGSRLLMVTGSAIEIFVFAIGLTYKIQQENKDKIHFQKESIRQKNKALRAQINPHFIFNSLSSIQHLITVNDKVSALKYLSKFSRLTRNILESSIETNVVLEDEIKMLNDYLELESLRFDNSFIYEITIDSKIDTNTVEVPYMILQPFVENAILHGLLPKKSENKKLVINFYMENNFVVCEIDDNGIGREASKELKQGYKKDKKSRGIEVTKNRLETLSEDKDLITIIDKYDENNNALGTKVILKILT